MAGSMLDLPAALRATGLRVWVAPDWRTNGHGVAELTDLWGGVLHHTAGLGLRAVYGLPDARIEVPQPRCNLWTPRPGTQPYDVAVVSAGRAWHAGSGRSAAYADLRAGRFDARTADAMLRWGSSSDDLDAGTTSAHTVGNEVEWLSGEVPDAQLAVIARTMRACVDLFGWPGVGSWAHHRQLTYRKPDMAHRGDIWSRAAAITEEDDVDDKTLAVLVQGAADAARARALLETSNVAGRVAATNDRVVQLLGLVAAAGVDSAKRDAGILGYLTAMPKPADMTPEEFAAALAPLLAGHGVDLDAATIAKAVRVELAGALVGSA